MKITYGRIVIHPVGSLNFSAIQISIGNEDRVFTIGKVLDEDARQYDSITVAKALHALAEELFDAR